MQRDSIPTADVAAAILRYIRARPDACDAIEGVTEWWLAQQRFEDSYSEVAAALQALVDRGDVQALHAADGHVIYCSAAHAAQPPAGSAADPQ